MTEAMQQNNRHDKLNRTLSVAPMMDWTDRHDRYFLRLLAPGVLLYTEMVTTGALIHGDVARHLDFNPEEHPVALQLGGSDPAALAKSARLGTEWGYDEINLNCGCPSDRVQNGSFGACLMAEPDRVADCVSAMCDAAPNVPVTVKTRIGIDHHDSYDFLAEFVGKSAEAGCKTFIVHARKAWLNGLSPKENREVPPLRYDVPARLKQDFPQLEIIVNGGIRTLADIQAQLKSCDGVMIGREAYQNPFFMAIAAYEILHGPAPPDRHDIVEHLVAYAEKQVALGVPLKSITRHLMGLFQGLPGARKWRRALSTQVHQPGCSPQILREAAAYVPRESCAGDQNTSLKATA